MKNLIIIGCFFVMLSIVSFGQSNQEREEIVSERGMYSNTFVKPGGGKEVVMSASAINYFNNGNWEPILQNLVPSTMQGSGFENTKNCIKSFYPANSGNSNSIKLTTNAGFDIFIHSAKKQIVYDNISGLIELNYAQNVSSCVVNNNMLTYPNIYTGISDEYLVQNGLIKNNIILESLPSSVNNISTGYYGFQEEIELPIGWTIVSAINDIEALTSSALKIMNENGEHVLTIPEPIFYDNQALSSDGSNIVEGKYLIREMNGTWLLSTLVPVEWLKSENREYPVTIDPSVTLTGVDGGWMSANNLVNNPAYVFIGVCCGNLEHRAWIKFNTAVIPDGSCVTDVRLQIYVNGVGASTPELVHAYDITGTFGPYAAIDPLVLADMANGYYTSFTIGGVGTYGYYDLGPSADALLQAQLPGDLFEVALIFDNEPSVNWKRLTATQCNIVVTYDVPPCVVLPIELAYFSANCEEGHTKLSWTTVSEMNNDRFELEKTYDQINFTTIASVKGVGTSTDVNNYSYVDAEKDLRTAYYRLKQIDFNGAYTYHDIIASNCLNSSIEMVMNNNTNVILVNSSDKLEGSYEIYNTLGESVQSGKLSNEIPFTKAGGIYFVHVTTNGETYNIEILKN